MAGYPNIVSLLINLSALEHVPYLTKVSYFIPVYFQWQ